MTAVTTDRPHDPEQPIPTTAELHLAWQRAKALWSSDPGDRDAYAAFIRAGTALYLGSQNPDPAPAPTSSGARVHPGSPANRFSPPTRA